jgi:hypothetical protein
MKVRIPIEKGNAALKDPQFGQKMGKLLADIKAEAAYFSLIDGQRGGYFIVNMDDPSQMGALAEPFFLWLNCDVKFEPVMLPADLQKAGPAIEAAVKAWS